MAAQPLRRVVGMVRTADGSDVPMLRPMIGDIDPRELGADVMVRLADGTDAILSVGADMLQPNDDDE